MLLMMARSWWAFALRGIAALVFGVVAIVWPALTLTALVLLFAGFAFVEGVLAIMGAVRNREGCREWWVVLLEGLAGVAIGVVTFLWPGIAALAFVFLIGAWAIATGLLEVTAAIALRRELTGEWLMVLGGLLSIVFGALIAARPGAGATAVAWIVGAYAVLLGVITLALSLRLRSWRRQLEQAATTV
jgi:uncharacterized membrane protein HdeD (DUF308 family)